MAAEFLQLLKNVGWKVDLSDKRIYDVSKIHMCLFFIKVTFLSNIIVCSKFCENTNEQETEHKTENRFFLYFF